MDKRASRFFPGRFIVIAAVVAVRGVLALDAQALAVDGDTGIVEPADPEAPVVTAAKVGSIEWNGTGATADGHRVKVLGNVGSATDAQAAALRRPLVRQHLHRRQQGRRNPRSSHEINAATRRQSRGHFSASSSASGG